MTLFELATTNDTGTITTGVTGGASVLRLDNDNDGDNEMAEVELGALPGTERSNVP